MIRVTTGSRLHFGLLNLQPIGGRAFGGIGLMIDRPGIRLRAEPAASWSAQGPCAERALAFAQRVNDKEKFAGPPLALTIEECAAEHCGLGTGTQLGLAVARAVSAFRGLAPTAAELALLVGRGLRSAIGTHGFDLGGLIVDGGKGPQSTLAPLLARQAFPEDWHILLVIPKHRHGLHGAEEGTAFAQATATPSDELCRLILLAILPAVAERDLRSFGEALHEFNRKVGDMFRPWQGGIYASPEVESVVNLLRDAGLHGVAQSSWGPTIFGFAQTEEMETIRKAVATRIARTYGDILITQARNSGALVEAQ